MPVPTLSYERLTLEVEELGNVRLREESEHTDRMLRRRHEIVSGLVFQNEIRFPDSRQGRRRHRVNSMYELHVVAVDVDLPLRVDVRSVTNPERKLAEAFLETILRRVRILVDPNENLRDRIHGDGNGIGEHDKVLFVREQGRR